MPSHSLIYVNYAYQAGMPQRTSAASLPRLSKAFPGCLIDTTSWQPLLPAKCGVSFRRTHGVMVEKVQVGVIAWSCLRQDHRRTMGLLLALLISPSAP